MLPLRSSQPQLSVGILTQRAVASGETIVPAVVVTNCPYPGGVESDKFERLPARTRAL
jgi:hypothetical protein